MSSVENNIRQPAISKEFYGAEPESIKRIRSSLEEGHEGVLARHGELILHSVFQPIVSLSHGRSVGYEALVRAKSSNNAPVSPLALFESITNESDLVYLDRLCRALHLENFVRTEDDISWIFLNVHPTVSVNGRHYGRFFEEFLSGIGLSPERVVIEILENSTLDDSQLADAMRFYRDRGCLVAIDDFGVGHSNFGRVWQIKPHIVKLDRSTLVFAQQDAAARRIFPQLVSLLHEAGCIVLIEGVETEIEALMAMESGADLVQGFFFARPESAINPIDHTNNAIQLLTHRYRIKLDQSSQNDRHADIAKKLFATSVEIIKHGQLNCPAVAHLLSLKNADRCYLIDYAGRQVGETHTAEVKQGNLKRKQFRPMDSAKDATWIGRSYWRRAIESPCEVQISRPYLSLATGEMCETLSLCFQGLGGPMVLCLDLAHDERA